jgi:hypothetical protein
MAQKRLGARRLLRTGLLALYCIALLLAADLIYASIPSVPDPPRIVGHPSLEHTLASNFDGYDVWGTIRHQLFTNNLGLKDSAVRVVPAAPTSRRIVLVGDSFVQAMGMTFEQSFAGLLHAEGQRRSEKIEFLNAGVVSYSPILYYRKIKYLLELGMRFDEVVVFPDLSDVQDEATSHFCIDDDPEYRKHCIQRGSPPRRPRLGDYFPVTNEVIKILTRKRPIIVRPPTGIPVGEYRRAGWTLANFDVGIWFTPLGVEGGIARALKNMQALADLLRERRIPLTVVVYPWPMQLAENDRESRQIAIWREFCTTNCKAFINLFPAFFAEKDAHPDWYVRLFIDGDVHFSQAGNRFVFEQVAKRLLPQ